MKPMQKSDGSKYYAYLIVYVDDVLAIEEKPNLTIDQIAILFRIKEGSVMSPGMYLGMDMRKWTVNDVDGTDVPCFALGANSYVKEAIRIAKRNAETHGLPYPTSKKTGKTPFAHVKYRPELDATSYCDDEKHTLFQNFIGMLRWMCELGRIDILHETSILSQYLANPRHGHLMQALHIFPYLKRHERSWMVMDPRDYGVDWKPKKNEVSPSERALGMQWLYPDSGEKIPHNAPQPRGEGVNINTFVGADHADNRVTRRSHTGIIIYCNMCPIQWFSKRQNSVESSTFSSEIVAMRIATEHIEF